VHILVLQESDWIERGPHQSHHLFERLRQRGHEVLVVDFEIGWRKGRSRGMLTSRQVFEAQAKVAEGTQIRVVRPASVHLPLIEYLVAYAVHSLEIRKQLRNFRPDVIVGLGLLDAFSGIRQARRAGVPFVYYLIDELHRLVPEPAFRGLARVIEQANIRHASLVISINRSLQEYTIEMGAPAERTKVLPAGVDLDRYVATSNGFDVRKRLGLEASDLVLLFMGWVYPFSGLREVAQSILAGDGEQFRIRLMVVGKGDSWEEIERIAKRNEAGGRIKMVGFRPYEEMPSFLAAADVCLLPAHNVETMRNIVPIKMYEYLAAGKPVIATRLPGLEKEFGESNGVVYVDGPEEVVNTAVELALGGSLRALGNKGRSFVSGLDWKSITDSFESDLMRLVECRDPV
jgi:glycosyltransferase involved in cell wall biosynthesis